MFFSNSIQKQSLFEELKQHYQHKFEPVDVG